MTRKYFGTDGIRGRVGVAPITPDFVMRLGYAAGKVLAQAGSRGDKRPTVLIGKDTRISGYMLEAALEAGFAAAGVDVMLCGPMPTPGVAYLTRALRLSAGVVISASHNHYADNGIKFFSSQGNKLADEVELAIEAALEEPMLCVSSDHLGKAKRLPDASGRYIEFCKSTFPSELDLRGLRIVVDCAHGAAYDIAPHVLHELGAEVIAIGNTPNGLNINDKVGATAPDALAIAVRANHADLGIALDGDADRLIMVDRHGKIYNGDQLLYLIVVDRLSMGPVAGAVGTLMTNMAVEIAFEKLGVGFVRARVGDRYVLEQMQERGWLIGGEGSGHLLCLDKHSTGDGIISALQVLSALRRSGKSLDACFSELHLFPQVLLNVRVAAGFDWQNNAALMQEKTAVEEQLKGRGRVLIRASGTEPLLRVMVEADADELANTCARRLVACIEHG
ncbi:MULTISPECIES: phosphoglucosamine mutase [unclassified Undibacterium]|uniref:phosphoglucosamine mutase n=1 Tax=unclassified Undibacterium TaxID=2630295 RepID=UPI002AC9C26B|nr:MULTISPECIES: phosphoglucosamine mutase [unclassified Undibacterium]MEB0138488.1 phosphoglucosamine mutase [Undibacterium sp. CCC2.1]MEB0173911.1 phosphoglucosamine mutase [Undibacterium sp. CCC1.1]MEB0176163.1 phosphoglucosamine mutase [Undibacterium sp. CCC3.4]MEB0215429.1 phosphoglucosamine mutase [Undibacterium sp. 5I2]WPX42769.1 phosphoglucosamine mutase [Undibacterium sp. CCC3.4]